MSLRITEAELDTADVQFVKEVLIAAPDEVNSGICVFQLKLLAPFVDRHSEAKVSPYQQLVVVVDDPDNPETQNRIRVKVLERFGRPAGLLSEQHK